MNTSPLFRTRCAERGFTIVELLVSTVLIAGIMVLMLTSVDQTQKLMTRTTAKVSQFQSARNGFDSMTRRLSQATLNTYWRAHDADLGNAKADFLFRRSSDLHFLSGPTAQMFSRPAIAGIGANPGRTYPTHSVFFQAPIGLTEEIDPASKDKLRTFRALDSLLSGCGYFIEFGDDAQRPEFLTHLQYPPDYRFRLMELTVPAEHLTIFNRPPGKEPTQTALKNKPLILDASQGTYIGLLDENRKSLPGFLRPLWMEQALLRRTVAGVQSFRFARPLAEDIIALIILPKVSERDRKTPDALDLAPEYRYDSWRIIKRDASAAMAVLNASRDNLLPPIVQVTMVALDRASAERLRATPTDVPDWTTGGTLFSKVKTEAELQTDLDALQTALREDPRRLNYRIFTTDVVIRGSKWSATP